MGIEVWVDPSWSEAELGVGTIKMEVVVSVELATVGTAVPVPKEGSSREGQTVGVSAVGHGGQV